MSTEKRFFRSRAIQRETREPLPRSVIQIGRDMLPIRLMLYRLKGSCRSIDPLTDVIYDQKNLVTKSRSTVPLSRVKLSYRIRRGYTKVLEGHLSRMGVPEDEKAAIIGKIFEVVEVAVPRLPITVIVEDVTVTVRIIYKKVRFDDSVKDKIKQTPCAICREDLDGDHRLQIARLPCSHLYHRHCISQWLDMDRRRSCVYKCRCAISVVEVGKPLTLLGWLPYRPMDLLMVSITGIITATLFCKILMPDD